MNIYIVIVTYNGEKWIEKCLSSVINSDISVKSVVIDNASNDKTLEIIKEQFPLVEIIENSENIGFGRANNIGIRKAYDELADYVFLLNQDAYVEQDTIIKLVSVANQHNDVGVVSPIHLNGNGSELDFKFSNYIIPRHCPNFYSDNFLNKLQDDIYTVRFVNAAAWLISRNCIKTVGGFNPIFKMYGEDDDYLHRVHYHGFKVGIYPFSKIYHDRAQINTTKYFTNEDKILKRELLVEYCNINNNIDIKYKFRELLLSCIKSIIKLKYDEFIKYRYQFKILLKYYKDIANARKKSMKQGLTFMLND